MIILDDSLRLKECYKANLLEAGCDEAGRGCLAGPVFAAAVILPPNFHHPLLTDSKKVTKANRLILREYIEQNALCFAVAQVNEDVIDKINILNATILAMHKALDQLTSRPEHIIIDGNRFKPYQQIPYLCIVKGDSLYANIAAASILAKTYHDDYMNTLHAEFPQYAWDKNQAYATEKHRAAIVEFGISKYHRRSFNLIDTQLKLLF